MFWLAIFLERPSIARYVVNVLSFHACPYPCLQVAGVVVSLTDAPADISTHMPPLFCEQRLQMWACPPSVQGPLGWEGPGVLTAMVILFGICTSVKPVPCISVEVDLVKQWTSLFFAQAFPFSIPRVVGGADFPHQARPRRPHEAPVLEPMSWARMFT